MTELPVLGIHCFAGTLDTATAAIVERARNAEGGTVCLANVHVIVTAQRDRNLRKALHDAWLVLPDGAPIAWAQRRLGASSERIAGPDLMPAVFKRGKSVGLRHFLFGATPSVVRSVEQNLRRQIPGIEIVGTYAPPHFQHSTPASLAIITATRPDIVWVALGAPKQELWAMRHASSLAPALIIGVGAAFDFHAGIKRRAPRWMQRTGLEWLHRLASEPRRLTSRYLNTNTRFLLLYLTDMLRSRHS